MKLVKALLLVAAVGAVNFAYADGNTCQNNKNTSREKSDEQRTAEAIRDLEQKAPKSANDSSTSA